MFAAKGPRLAVCIFTREVIRMDQPTRRDFIGMAVPAMAAPLAVLLAPLPAKAINTDTQRVVAEWTEDENGDCFLNMGLTPHPCVKACLFSYSEDHPKQRTLTFAGFSMDLPLSDKEHAKRVAAVQVAEWLKQITVALEKLAYQPVCNCGCIEKTTAGVGDGSCVCANCKKRR